MTCVAAFDVGGTRMKGGLVVDGRVEPLPWKVTAGLDGPAVLGLLVATVREVVAGGGVDAVGIATPGIVDDGRVIVLPGKFPGLVGLDVAGVVADVAQVPVRLMNDATAAGVGEATAGAGMGHDRVVVMTIGTGIGVAVVENGRPVGEGPWGGGVMGGHMPIASPDEGPLDSNGGRGTIEALCAAERLLDAARAARCDVADVPALLERWSRGDEAARAAVASYRKSLEQSLVALAHAHTPSVIVVGGGPVSTSSEWLLGGMTEAVRSRLWERQRCAVVPAALGDAAALVGLASLAAGPRRS
jgi:glucokinase